MLFDEKNGKLLSILDKSVDGPMASAIGPNGDLFLSSFNTGEVLRFNSSTGAYLGVFIKAGEGGLTNPVAPCILPDGNAYVGDFATNRILHFDKDGNFVEVFADSTTSDLNGPFMMLIDDNYLYIASGFTHSVLRWELKTKKYLGAFVKPESGGLKVPIGLLLGPDGNLYASSSGTNSILRYDGKTGEFMDEFVKAGSGGLDSPRASNFAGTNSDLFIVSFNNNKILRYDRVSGSFLGVVATNEESGFLAPRGLTFNPLPNFLITASTSTVEENKALVKVNIGFTVMDFTDPNPRVQLVGISVNGKNINSDKYAKKSKKGLVNNTFYLATKNDSDKKIVYTFTYRATNKSGGTKLASTTVAIPPSGHTPHE